MTTEQITKFISDNRDVLIFGYSVIIGYLGYKLGSITEREQYQKELHRSYQEAEALREMLHNEIRGNHRTVTYRLTNTSSVLPRKSGGIGA